MAKRTFYGLYKKGKLSIAGKIRMPNVFLSKEYAGKLAKAMTKRDKKSYEVKKVIL